VITNTHDKKIIRPLVAGSLFSDDESSKIDRVLDVAYQLLEIPSGSNELYEPIWAVIDDCCCAIKESYVQDDSSGGIIGHDCTQEGFDELAIDEIVKFLQTVSIIFNKSDEREKIKQMFKLCFPNLKPLYENLGIEKKEKVELKMVEAEA